MNSNYYIEAVSADNLHHLPGLIAGQAAHHGIVLSTRAQSELRERLAPHLGLSEDSLQDPPVARAFFVRPAAGGPPAGYFVTCPFRTLGANRIYMEDLYTNPEHRGRGVAQFGMQGLAHQAQVEECAYSMDWVVADNNTSANGFYATRMGAHRMGAMHSFPTAAIGHSARQRDDGRYVARELQSRDLPALEVALRTHAPHKADRILRHLGSESRDWRHLDLVAVDRGTDAVVGVATGAADLSTFRGVVGHTQSFGLLTSDRSDANQAAISNALHRGTCRELSERGWTGHIERVRQHGEPAWEAQWAAQHGGGPAAMTEDPATEFSHRRLRQPEVAELARQYREATGIPEPESTGARLMRESIDWNLVPPIGATGPAVRRGRQTREPVAALDS